MAVSRSMSLGHTAMGPKASAKLAATLRLTKVTSLTISNNPIGDGAMVELLEGLKDVGLISLSISNARVGVSSAGKLAELLSSATKFRAAVNCLTLDMNGIFGELYSNGDVNEADKFASDCDAFLAALKGSNIVTLSLQKTGIGPITLHKLAISLPAVVTSINCLANQFGDAYLAILLNVAIRIQLAKDTVHIQG